MPTLYTTPLSANGRKVLAAVRHLDLDVAIELVNVYKGEGRAPAYLAVNPSGKIPTLVDGELVLPESNAILQYLDEAYGDQRLSSRDAKKKAQISRWLFWEAFSWQPSLTLVLAGVVGEKLGLVPHGAPRSETNWGDERFVGAATLLAAHLQGRAFLVGETLTLADLSIAGMMTYARAAGFPFATYPSIAAWYQRIEGLPAWQETAVDPWR